MNKKVIFELKGMYRDDFRISAYEFGQGKKTLCIVGACRGNEIQPLYTTSLLIKKFKQLEEEGRINQDHSILIIPSLNPYSMNIKKRFWSTDNTDINRMFPGYDLGETTQRIAQGVFDVVSEYSYGIQLTSFYTPGDFVPHVRMMDLGNEDVELAKQFGLPYVVLRQVRPYDTTTLNYNWQCWNTKAFSLYTSTTSRIDQNSAGQAVLSVMNFLSSLDVIKYTRPFVMKSQIVKDTDLVSVRTEKSGIFEPLVEPGQRVFIGQPMANILHPYEAEILETLYAPINSTVFFLHNDPLTYANTSVIKMII